MASSTVLGWRGLILASLLLPVTAHGQIPAPPATVELPLADVEKVLNGYLFPHTTQPGDVIPSALMLRGCIAMQAQQPGVIRDNGQCPAVSEALKARAQELANAAKTAEPTEKPAAPAAPTESPRPPATLPMSRIPEGLRAPAPPPQAPPQAPAGAVGSHALP